MAAKDAHIVDGRLYVPYQNWVGGLASDFFKELKEHKRIWGTSCQSCSRVFMPPRSICPNCFERIQERVELPPTGRLMVHTVVHYTYSPYYQPMEAPYAVGIIKLDGADTGLCHLLGEVDLETIKPGMRVQAVFREERQGNILDIAYFKPL